MADVMVIKGVKARLGDRGMAELNLEDVARGLGFVETKNGKEYVMWRRVMAYIAEFGFSALVPKDSFIPENIFYKLCFKAENEVARAFQDMVTDEILPTIRKHGAYITPDTLENMIASPEFGIQLLTALKAEREQRERLEAEASETDYNMPTQYSMELGLFEIKETNVVHSDGHVSISKTPKITGRGQIYFVNKLVEKTA